MAAKTKNTHEVRWEDHDGGEWEIETDAASAYHLFEALRISERVKSVSMKAIK